MKFLRWLDQNLEKYIMVTALVAISCLLMLQVIMRYVFQNALGWPEELSRYFFILFSFTTLGFCLKYDLNFNIDLLIKIMPSSIQKIQKIVTYFGFLFFYGFCTFYSFRAVQFAAETGNVTPGLQIPVFILYILSGLGLFIGTARAVQSIIINISQFNKPKEGVIKNA